jgi:membrane-associated phospholipid phosphatase
VILNQRRALVVSGAMLALAVLIGLFVALPTPHDGVQWVDDGTRRAAAAVQNRPTTLLAEGLSFVGGVWVNWTLRVAAAVLLAVKRRFLQLVAFALAVASSEALIGTLKAAFHRARPLSSLITTSSYSFPSGHAIAAAVTAVGLVVVALPPGRARWKWEVRATLFASVMALSRVYLQAHWLSDVVAGGLLGGGLALGWPAVLQTWRARLTPAPPELASATDARP